MPSGRILTGIKSIEFAKDIMGIDNQTVVDEGAGYDVRSGVPGLAPVQSSFHNHVQTLFFRIKRRRAGIVPARRCFAGM
jgi:hypothetical protein